MLFCVVTPNVVCDIHCSYTNLFNALTLPLPICFCDCCFGNPLLRSSFSILKHPFMCTVLLSRSLWKIVCSVLSFPHHVLLQTTATTTTTTTTPTTTPHRLLLLLRLLFSFFFLQDLLCHAWHGIRTILIWCPQFLFLRFGFVCLGCTPSAACTGLSSITSFSICIFVGNGYLCLPSLPNRDLRKRWTRCLFLISFSRS